MAPTASNTSSFNFVLNSQKEKLNGTNFIDRNLKIVTSYGVGQQQ
jgi:hypothetical protein